MRIAWVAGLLVAFGPALASAQPFDVTLPRAATQHDAPYGAAVRPLPTRIAALRSYDARVDGLRRDVAAQKAEDGGTLTEAHNQMFLDRYAHIRGRLLEQLRRTDAFATNADGRSVGPTPTAF